MVAWRRSESASPIQNLALGLVGAVLAFSTLTVAIMHYRKRHAHAYVYELGTLDVEACTPTSSQSALSEVDGTESANEQD
ncbi:hypothetical protein CC78DRAFT_582875 [Lojkania enalia]|uniref:Uncharacterized protein n=1 Tax=Lojkania enalia TaxID=147567 RepID=A0A9P4N4M7_9PLEO|nr:hypothetical protein CC78DRAFT_582875 [Didymosphaeria enalia]